MSRNNVEVVFPDSNRGSFEGFVRSKRASGYIYNGGLLGTVRRLAEFLDARGDGANLSEEAVLEWIKRIEGESRGTQRIRGCVARQYGLYLQSLGVQCYVLPALMVPKAPPNFEPFIFSAEQIEAVAEVLDNETPSLSSPNTSTEYPLLFRMLYGCGLRISEATSLRGRDVDVEAGTLDVLDGKGGISRRVPMSASLTRCCKRYIEAMGPSVTGDNYFFPGQSGEGHLNRGTVLTHLKKAFASAGVVDTNGKPPRVHDLRHTLVCHTIERASDAGVDANVILPVLAVMSGHTNLKMTERYIHLTDAARSKVVEQMAASSSATLREVEG